MTFPQLPTPPSTSNPATFSALADAFFSAMPEWSEGLADYGNAISLGFTSVSSTSVTVPTLTAGGTSSVTLVVEASKGFVVGMPVMVVAAAALTGARMLGTISAYNSSTGSLTVVVQHAMGAGSTFAAWRVTLTAPVLSSQLWTLVDTTASSTIDCGLANYFTRTVNGATTFAFSNAPSGQAYSFTLEVNHVSGAISWPASVVWPFGLTAPGLTAGRKHLFVFSTTNGGTLWRGGALSNYNT